MEIFPDSLAVVFCRMKNLEDLQSLARTHNRLNWESIHASHSVGCKGIPYAETLSVDSYGSLIEFEPSRRYFMSSEQMRLRTRRDHDRVRPERYLQGRLGPGE